MWIDSHCHLGEVASQSEEKYLQTMQAAIDSGISRFLVIAMRKEEYLFLKKRKALHDPIDIAIGIHPFEELCHWELSEIEELISSEDIVAIGEIGLDFSRKENLERQRYLFCEQLRIAEKYKKPVIIHSRKAEKEMLDILLSYEGKFLMHAYSGSRESYQQLRRKNSFFSFGTILLSDKAHKRKAVAKAIDLHQLLIESDAPYGYRSQEEENTPSSIVACGECLAELHAVSTEKIQQILIENYQRFLKG